MNYLGRYLHIKLKLPICFSPMCGWRRGMLVICLSLLMYISCQEKEVDNSLDYKLKVEEIKTFDQYKKSCHDNCFLYTDSIFKVYNQDYVMYLYTFTKIKSKDDYFLIEQLETPYRKTYYILEHHAFLCMNNELKKEFQKNRNYLLTGYNSWAVKYIKIKNNASISTLEMIERRKNNKIGSCVVVKEVAFYDAKNEKIMKLYIDQNDHKLYATFDEILKKYNFTPWPPYENGNEFEEEEIKDIKESFKEKDRRFIEVLKDTFIHYERSY